MLKYLRRLVESCGQKWYDLIADIGTIWSIDVPSATVLNRPSDSSPMSAIGTEGGPFHGLG